MLLTVNLDRLDIARGELLLDAGCGEGRHSFGALARGARVVALDLDLDSMRPHRKRLNAAIAESAVRAARAENVNGDSRAAQNSEAASAARELGVERASDGRQAARNSESFHALRGAGVESASDGSQAARNSESVHAARASDGSQTARNSESFHALRGAGAESASDVSQAARNSENVHAVRNVGVERASSGSQALRNSESAHALRGAGVEGASDGSQVARHSEISRAPRAAGVECGNGLSPATPASKTANRALRAGGFVRGDTFALPFAEAVFDHVICAEVMEHVHDYRAAARELARVTKPGGRVAVTIPTATSEHLYLRLGDDYFESPGGHIRIFRPRELARALAAAGLRTEGCSFAHGLHTFYWALRSLAGLPRADEFRVVRAFRALLIRASGSRGMDAFEKRVLNWLCPKSVVLYARKVRASRSRA